MRKIFKNRKGFSLAEVIVVVAIIAILGAVTVINFPRMIKQINQTKHDSNAQLIYSSVQNRLTELRAAGNLELVTKNSSVAAVGTKPSDWPEESYGDSALKRIIYSKGDSEIAKLFPEIPGDSLSHNWVVEFNDDGLVYAAFYSEKEKGEDFYPSRADKLRQSFAARMEDGATVGYFGGGSQTEYKSMQDFSCQLDIINKDILGVQLKITGLTTTQLGQVNLKVYVRGKSSSKTAELTATPDENGIALVPIDSVAAGGCFADNEIFSDFTPGEDLEITASASIPGFEEPKPVTASVNSLFDKIDDAGTIHIKYARHLQNLDKTYSGYEPTNSVSVQQDKSIDFTEDAPYLWGNIVPTKTFVPITNQKISSFDGRNFGISNMNIAIPSGSTAVPAGLFGEFSGSELVDINLIGANVSNGTTGPTGSLAGSLIGSVQVTNCASYLTYEMCHPGSSQKKLATEVQWITGAGNVGGLIGEAATVTIEDSFSSTVANSTGGGYVGGLIGSASGTASVTESYADCYLFGSGNVGGLIGTAGTADISTCYSAGYLFQPKEPATAGTVGTAAGLVSKGSTIKISDSYSVFDFAGLATAYYGVAPVDSDCTNTYYTSEPKDKTTDIAGKNVNSEELTAFAQKVEGDSLSDKFNNDVNGSHSTVTTAYNIDSVTNRGQYPYPMLNACPHHYGDWNYLLVNSYNITWKYQYYNDIEKIDVLKNTVTVEKGTIVNSPVTELAAFIADNDIFEYVFEGWYIESTPDTIVSTDQSYPVTVNDTVVYVAKIKATKKYTVSWEYLIHISGMADQSDSITDDEIALNGTSIAAPADALDSIVADIIKVDGLNEEEVCRCEVKFNCWRNAATNEEYSTKKTSLPVTGEDATITYVADVSITLSYYVTWENYKLDRTPADPKEYDPTNENDVKVIDWQYVEYGKVPQFSEATPKITNTDEYSYAFIGWDRAYTQVTGVQKYVAVFKEIDNGSLVIYYRTSATGEIKTLTFPAATINNKVSVDVSQMLSRQDGYVLKGFYNDKAVEVGELPKNLILDSAGRIVKETVNVTAVSANGSQYVFKLNGTTQYLYALWERSNTMEAVKGGAWDASKVKEMIGEDLILGHEESGSVYFMRITGTNTISTLGPYRSINGVVQADSKTFLDDLWTITQAPSITDGFYILNRNNNKYLKWNNSNVEIVDSVSQATVWKCDNGGIHDANNSNHTFWYNNGFKTNNGGKVGGIFFYQTSASSYSYDYSG